MEALVVKWHVLRLSTYQLPKITAPGHPSVVPKLIVWWGHQYVLCRINYRRSIKSDSIPCQYSVKEALVVKWHVLRLSTYQLPKITVLGHPSVVKKKLIVVRATVCS